jgi:hypothetical protein
LDELFFITALLNKRAQTWNNAQQAYNHQHHWHTHSMHASLKNIIAQQIHHISMHGGVARPLMQSTKHPILHLVGLVGPHAGSLYVLIFRAKRHAKKQGKKFDFWYVQVL